MVMTGDSNKTWQPAENRAWHGLPPSPGVSMADIFPHRSAASPARPRRPPLVGASGVA
jgi:hypothetical protein